MRAHASPGPLNSISLILFATVKRAQDVARPQNEQSGLFFYHSPRLPSTVLCSFSVQCAATTAATHPPPPPPPRPTVAPLATVFILFYFFFISHFTLFRLVPGRSLTFEHVPRGSRRPRVRANNTRKLHWDSFYFVFFFFFPTVYRLLNNSVCTLEVGSRCETVTALWVHSILVCARKKKIPVKWPHYSGFNSDGFDQTSTAPLLLYIIRYALCTLYFPTLYAMAIKNK